ncbi:MAG: CoA transferase [Dehalococcoidales bacterium]|nr:CoA transferase [Dehalococcoidales bacterium]
MDNRLQKEGLLPLSGRRVVEFTVHWAGPMCGVMLADMGAEVIKIENPALPDASRRFEPFADDKRGINRSGYFALLNRGKKDCALDLKQPENIALIKKLIGTTDIVIQNFAPRVLESLGLGYAALKEVKPDLIMISLSGFGATGLDKDCLALGQVVEAYSGVNSVMGYAGKPPLGCGTVIPDQISATTAAFAALAALHYRDLTGEGQHIDISEVESLIACMPEYVMEFTMNGRNPVPQGNHDSAMAPHGCYRCRGKDDWVAIAVKDDFVWKNLCRVMDAAELADDVRFRDGLCRLQNQEELDMIISRWTAGQNKMDVMTRLQKAGVACAPVYSGEELFKDAHLRAREFFVEIEHPEAGKRELLGLFAKLSDTPGRVRGRDPLFGEHNDWLRHEFRNSKGV